MTVQPDRYEFIKNILGKDQVKKIQSTRLLMVGAGGIGCEMLKNLVLAGFQDIEVVDLDTIDLSNLNRQFLFQKQHIKKPKAHVARESALKFNPSVKITSHHASIFDAKFDLNWFTSFGLVLNALDNVAARSHVNMMCLAAGIPLVESGTAGYRGQVTVHLKDISACYDCHQKPLERKTYPICTIRSTPSEPIHCIVWSKSFLFSQLFHTTQEEEAVASNDGDDQNAKELEELKKETEALKRLRQSINEPDFPQLVFDKVFQADIQRLLGFEDMWKTKRAPVPLTYAKLEQESKKVKIPDPSKTDYDQKIWCLQESFKLFVQSLNELTKELLEMKKSDPDASLEFDKDHDAALSFVTASANIRATIFGIPLKSRFDVKQMAGNIIPAIATTNAIVAGMVVMSTFKILSGQAMTCQNTFVSYGGDRKHILANDGLSKPNPFCAVCTANYTGVKLDVQSATIGDLITETKRDTRFAFGDEIVLQFGDKLLYDADFDDNEESTLNSMGITSGSRLTLIHESEDTPVITTVVHLFVHHEEGAKLAFSTAGTLKAKPQMPSHSDEAIATSSKRAMEDTSASSAKKLKSADGPILIDDTEDDLVIL